MWSNHMVENWETRKMDPPWPDFMIMADRNGNKMIHPRRTLRSARFDRQITRINHINQKFNWPKVKLKQSDSKPDSSRRIWPILEQFKLNLLSNCCSMNWVLLGHHLVEAYLKTLLEGFLRHGYSDIGDNVGDFTMVTDFRF